MCIHVINCLTSTAFPIELNKKEIDVIIVPSGDYCVVSFPCSDSEFLIIFMVTMLCWKIG